MQVPIPRPVAAPAPEYSLPRMARYFLWLGTIGFGGPIALAAYMQRDLVEQRQWLTNDEYLEGLALAQLAPGPLAAQLAMYLGYVRGGWLGATVVGFVFIAPSFLMVVLLALAYVRYGGLAWMQALFYGIGAAVIGIIARSAWKLMQATLKRDVLLWTIFAVLAVSTAATEREIVWLFLAGGLTALAVKAFPRNLASTRLPAVLLASLPPTLQLGKFGEVLGYFAKAGLFVFGSGLAIVPFLHGGVVVDHSRRETIAPTVLNFNKTVGDFTNLLPRLLGEDIEVVRATSEAPLFVKASPVQIGQIIMNLAVNARDAMPGGGKLIIQTASSEQDANGTQACLSITDTGIGMDEDTLSRIFEPYFSTKEKGKGTGLGLSVVYGIVEQNGGRVVVDSKPGRGTSVQIFWPEVEPPHETAEPSPIRPTVPRGAETILLVEDFEGLRQMTRSFLEMQGYKVLEARNGAEAIPLVQRYHDRIDLLLTDVIMPGMNGAELAERLNKLRPGIAVLFVSGYTADVLDRHGVSRAGLLDKPFTFESLAHRIREILGMNQGQKIA